MNGSCSTREAMSSYFLQEFVDRPEGYKQVGRSKRRWDDNIKRDRREMGLYRMDWINLA